MALASLISMGLAIGTAGSAHAFEAKPFDVTELNDRADADIARAFAGAAKEQTIAVDDAAYRQFLSAYVVDRPGALNLVRYGDVTPADREALKRQIAEWEALEWKKLTAAQKFAFFVNLYNAVTLDVVLDHYPVESIRDIEIGTEDRGFFASLSSAFNHGPWSAKRVRVGGVELSLDDIEHAILRPMGDPRVHYAVNCASVGCPDLRPGPWAAETLDADLDAAARAYVNSERGLRESPGGGLLASRIYDWFGEDFGGEAGLRAHLERYAEGETVALLSGEDPEIVGYRYDWSLNDASRQ